MCSVRVYRTRLCDEVRYALRGWLRSSKLCRRAVSSGGSTERAVEEYGKDQRRPSRPNIRVPVDARDVNISTEVPQGDGTATLRQPASGVVNPRRLLFCAAHERAWDGYSNGGYWRCRGSRRCTVRWRGLW